MMDRRLQAAAIGAMFALTMSSPALAAPDKGDTAFVLVSTVLVLLMTIPGLALFYCGLVRTKNALSTLMQVYATVCLVCLLWMLYGYSLAFTTDAHVSPFVGGLSKAFLSGVTADTLAATFTPGVYVPEYAYIWFQMTFAAITPALIVGAFAERMRFGPLLAFVALWLSFGYLPIAHMTWAGPGGLFWDWGVLDFAGGTVVHVNAGVAGLVAALMVGKRRGFPSTMMPPHNLALTLIGASLLWVGWFGFNAGSAVAANGSAGMAMLVTQVASASAALAWMAMEWWLHGKPSLLGIASGAVAGLVAITPASGSCGPLGALAIGAAAGVLCLLASSRLKRRLGYDDALDVFGVHGVGGIVGALLTAVFAAPALGGVKDDAYSIGAQLVIQLKGVGTTIVWSAVVAFIAYKVVAMVIGLRAAEDEEREGLDITSHGETAYHN